MWPFNKNDHSKCTPDSMCDNCFLRFRRDSKPKKETPTIACINCGKLCDNPNKCTNCEKEYFKLMRERGLYELTKLEQIFKKETTMTPHKHADLIKAWADGATIEFFSKSCNEWKFISSPTWHEDFEYRIKPQPKDVIVTMYINPSMFVYREFDQLFTKHNIKLTFDGETGKLKADEVIE